MVEFSTGVDEDGDPTDYWIRIYPDGIRVVFAELLTPKIMKEFIVDLNAAVAVTQTRPVNVIPFISQ